MRRIDNLTGVRGFAAAWVVLFHFQSTPVVENALNLGAVVAHGAWGVDIFFVLSGFILALTYAPGGDFTWTSFRSFVRKRFARIYPLHLATFLLMVLIWEAAAHAGYKFNSSVVNDWWSALCNVLMLHAWGLTRQLSWNSPSWSISAEWFAYLLIFPLCVNLLRRVGTGGVLVLTLLAWASFLAWLFHWHAGVLEDINTNGFIRIVPEFLGGYACYRLVAQRAESPVGMALATGGVLAILGLTFLPRELVIFLLPAVMVLMLGLYYGGGWVDRVFGSKLMVWLGEISYSIYMVHLFVGLVAGQVLKRLPLAPTLFNGLAVLAVELALAVLCGHLGWKFVEDPARHYLTRKAATSPARQAPVLS